MILLSLLGFLPKASAASIEQLGSGAPGVDDMWSQLKQTFPHTDMGSGGLMFVILMVSNFILRLIGGIAILMIVYGGIRMIMTVADENSQAGAKKIVMYACIGLVLTIAADAIVGYVMTIVQSAAGG